MIYVLMWYINDPGNYHAAPLGVFKSGEDAEKFLASKVDVEPTDTYEIFEFKEVM